MKGTGMMTIQEAFTLGHRRLTRAAWIHGDYLELACTPDGARYGPIATLHTPHLDHVNDVPLWQVEQDGWEPFHD
jgi:hypothetical protein